MFNAILKYIAKIELVDYVFKFVYIEIISQIHSIKLMGPWEYLHTKINYMHFKIQI